MNKLDDINRWTPLVGLGNGVVVPYTREVYVPSLDSISASKLRRIRQILDE